MRIDDHLQLDAPGRRCMPEFARTSVPGDVGEPLMISKNLALLELSGLDSAKIFGIIAAEVRAILGVPRVVIWHYVPSLHRLIVEQDGVEIDALYISLIDADILMQAPAIWTTYPDGVKAELVTKSFGITDTSNEVAVCLPLCGMECSAVLLFQVPDVNTANRVIDSSRALVAQIGAVMSNYSALERASYHEAQLEALYETAGEISAELDLDSVLRAIASRAKKLVDAPISYIMLVDRELSDVYMCTTIGTTSREFSTLRLALGDGLGGRTAQEIRPLYTKDYLNDQHFRHVPDVDQAVRLEGIKSILGVPMKALTKFVGVLYVADRTERVFTDSDVEVLSSLAHHATLAVGNSALYESVATALDQLERMQEVAAEQFRKLKASDALNQILSELIVLGEGIDGVTRQLAGLVDGHVVVCDEHGCVISSAGEPEDEFSWALASRGGRPRRTRGGIAGEIEEVIGGLEHGQSVVLPGSSASRLKECLVVPVSAGGEVMGSIWIRVAAERLAEQQAVLEGATRVVALELAHGRAIAALEARMHGELLEDLLTCRPEAMATIVRRGIELGVDLASPHHVGVISLRVTDPGAGDRTRGMRPRAAQDDLVKALAAAQDCSFVGVVSGLVVVLMPAGSGDPGSMLRHLLARQAGSDVSYHAAVSEVVRDVGGYGDAFDAAKRGLVLAPDGSFLSVVDLSKAGILPLLFRRGGDTELRRFADRVLGTVVSYDERHAADLCRTLQAYADAGGSPGGAATILGVHVNTVYYRLKKLETLLGRDFLEPQRLVDIQVALLARRFLALEETVW